MYILLELLQCRVPGYWLLQQNKSPYCKCGVQPCFSQQTDVLGHSRARGLEALGVGCSQDFGLKPDAKAGFSVACSSQVHCRLSRTAGCGQSCTIFGVDSILQYFCTWLHLPGPLTLFPSFPSTQVWRVKQASILLLALSPPPPAQCQPPRQS